MKENLLKIQDIYKELNEELDFSVEQMDDLLGITIPELLKDPSILKPCIMWCESNRDIQPKHGLEHGQFQKLVELLKSLQKLVSPAVKQSESVSFSSSSSSLLTFQLLTFHQLLKTQLSSPEFITEEKLTTGKKLPSKEQYKQIYQWIFDGQPNSSPGLDLTSLNLNLAFNSECPPLLCVAAAWGFYHKVAKLAEAGADIDQGDLVLEGFTPLMHAVVQKRPKATLEILIKAGANPNFEGMGEMTPFLQAVIMSDREAADYFAKNGAKISWKPEPKISYFKDLYAKLKSQIFKEYEQAKVQDKLFLVSILEEHNHYESQIIQAMVIDIMSGFNIKCYLELIPKAEWHDLAGDMAKEHKIKIENIDVNRGKQPSSARLDLEFRDKGMIAELLKPENESGILVIGAGHAILCSDSDLQKKFYIYNICTTKRLFETFPFEPKDLENFLCLRKSHPVFFKENPIHHSEAIVNLLIEIEKARATKQSVRAVFVKSNIFPAVPTNTQSLSILEDDVKSVMSKPKNINFLESSSFAKSLKKGLAAQSTVAKSDVKPKAESDKVSFLKPNSSFAANLQKGLRKELRKESAGIQASP